MFIGEYHHSMDAKNRIIIPSKFREELTNTFILTRGVDKCISIYTKEHFEKIVENLRRLPEYSKKNRAYKQMILSSSINVETDSMGRIQIPQFLKTILPEKECTFVGIDDHIEIWSSTVWEQHYNDIIENIEDISEEIGEHFNS